jgi:RNA polymerase sigma-70 factor, ECF subfamily
VIEDNREVSDSELMMRLRRSDEAALAELYRRFAPQLCGLALHILWSHEDAEEIVQDVFLKLYRKPELYRPELASPAAYLNTMARNAAISRLRHHRSQIAATSDLDVHDPQSRLYTTEADPMDLIMAKEMLEQLNAEDRGLLEAAFFQGLSHSELADHSGVPLGTVKTRLRRALHKLRQQVGLS